MHGFSSRCQPNSWPMTKESHIVELMVIDEEKLHLLAVTDGSAVHGRSADVTAEEINIYVLQSDGRLTLKIKLDRLVPSQKNGNLPKE